MFTSFATRALSAVRGGATRTPARMLLLAPAGAAACAAACAAAPAPGTWPPMAASADGAVVRDGAGGLVSVSATLNYLDPSCTSVEVHRDTGGSDGALEGAHGLSSRTD